MLTNHLIVFGLANKDADTLVDAFVAESFDVLPANFHQTFMEDLGYENSNFLGTNQVAVEMRHLGNVTAKHRPTLKRLSSVKYRNETSRSVIRVARYEATNLWPVKNLTVKVNFQRSSQIENYTFNGNLHRMNFDLTFRRSLFGGEWVSTDNVTLIGDVHVAGPKIFLPGVLLHANQYVSNYQGSHLFHIFLRNKNSQFLSDLNKIMPLRFTDVNFLKITDFQ